MPKVLILGAGLSGLSAGIYLSEAGVDVTILDSSIISGGRSRSFFHKRLNCEIDNGQHLIMGCYSNTLDYISKIKSTEELQIFKTIDFTFVNKKGEKSRFKVPQKFYPLNVFYALFKFNLLSLTEKIQILKLFLKIKFKLKVSRNLTTKDWLHSENQSENSINSFWKVLNDSILNTNIEESLAEVFLLTLKEIFLKGQKKIQTILPRTNLDKLLIKPAISFLLKNNTEINLGEKADEIVIENNKIIKVITKKNIYQDFDYIISAVPFTNLKKLLPEISKNEFKYNSIVTVYIWLKQNPFKEKFIALLNANFHWLFNHNDYITVLKSDANDISILDKNKIMEICISELEEFFSEFDKKYIEKFEVIKERKATFAVTPNSKKIRNNINISFDNLFIAGDWTNTGLPGTIEGAILSGKISALRILNKLK